MAVYLEEYIDSIENVPAEIKHHLSEIKVRNETQSNLKKAIVDAQKQYFKDSNNGPAKANVDAKYEEAKNLAEENIALGDKCLDLLTRHIKRLDEQIILATKNVEEQGLSVFDTMMEERASSSAAAGASVAGGSGNGPPGRKKKSSSSGGGGNTKGFNMGMLSGMDTDGLEDSYDEDGGEPVYCVCQQESYGEMIACDNAESCPFEWFHYGCVGLTAPPQGAWICPVCASKFKKKKF